LASKNARIFTIFIKFATIAHARYYLIADIQLNEAIDYQQLGDDTRPLVSAKPLNDPKDINTGINLVINSGLCLKFGFISAITELSYFGKSTEFISSTLAQCRH
jgi:hypothetical protein